jgi:adenosine deaminase
VGGIRIALVADLVRDYGPEAGTGVLHELTEVRESGVIGIGLGGSEADYPPELFRAVFAEARERGFHTTAHAGEAAGPASIWGALLDLGVERIGHGTRAVEDERLLDHLAASGIPLEICPISNVCTGVVPSLAEHPVRQFFDRGVPVTINTDDPLMFGNSSADELRALHLELGFSREDICSLLLQAIEAAWMPETEKHLTRTEFFADPLWIKA